jgi:electron transport complex protein RnfG
MENSINYLKKFYPVVIITVIVLISVLICTFIKNATDNNSKALCDSETLLLLQKVFTETDSYIYEDSTEIYTLYKNNGDKIGYAFISAGKGFSGAITVLIGIENKETIKAISVLRHNDAIYTGGEDTVPLEFSDFVEQFESLNIENCFLREEGGQIDSITGATKSSQAVVDIVREAVLLKTVSIS